MSFEAFAGPSDAALFYNKEFNANLKEVELHSEKFPSTSFLSSFRNPDAVSKNKIFSQTDSLGRPDGFLLVSSGSDGSVLATGRVARGSIRSVKVYAEEKVVFQKDFPEGEDSIIPAEIVTALPEESFSISEERQKVLREIAESHTLTPAEKKPKLLLAAKIAGAKLRENITGKPESIPELEAQPIEAVQKPMPDQASPKTEAVDLQKIDPKSFMANAKEAFEENFYVQNVSSEEGLSTHKNDEIPSLDPSDVISVQDTSDFRSINRGP